MSRTLGDRPTRDEGAGLQPAPSTPTVAARLNRSQSNAVPYSSGGMLEASTRVKVTSANQMRRSHVPSSRAGLTRTALRPYVETVVRSRPGYSWPVVAGTFTVAERLGWQEHTWRSSRSVGEHDQSRVISAAAFLAQVMGPAT